jgi:hypothetical protein
MREQRRDFIPDGWISGRFPVGRGRFPILGVRSYDAIAFCDWLSKREVGEWRYRLPTLEEATLYPLRLHTQELIGYWTMEADGKFKSLLIGHTTERASGEVSYLASTLKSLSHCTNYIVETFANPQNDNLIDRSGLIRVLEMEIDIAIKSSRNLNLDIVRDLEVVKSKALLLTRNLGGDSTHQLVNEIADIVNVVNGNIAVRMFEFFEGIRIVKERVK